ncbi:glycosyltransferase [Bacillus sp. JJ1764]|uniref:glycosyltransferase n=1 Tax=Bacillus sp. JJ1764 TaxID=3122964 RepID=UPI002FFE54F8
MKILYFGTACSSETFHLINQNSKIKSSAAPQSFQNLLLKGLIEADVDLDIKTVLPIAHYPISTKFFIQNKKDKIVHGKYTTYLPAINLLGLKQVCYLMDSVQTVIKWNLKNKKEKERIILIYGMYMPVSLPLVLLSKLFGFKTVTFVNDLPELMFKYTKESGIKSYLIPIYIKLSRFINDKFDGYLCVSKYLGEIVNSKNKPNEIIEAFADIENGTSDLLPLKREKAIMYAGTLHKQFGIDKLLYAFKEIKDPELELWLFGTGDLANEIISEAKNDSRIKYFGMKSWEEVVEHEKRAQLLVNPRFSGDEYTKYSFPSKTMEYMLSGTPVLMTKLKGMDEEYFKHVYITTNETVLGWKEALEKTLQRNPKELEIKGKGARQFLIKNKNLRAQTNKLVDLLYRVLEKRNL